MNHAGRHREGGDARSPDHGVDLFLCEEVHDLAEDHAARGVKDERHETEAKDHEGLKREEGRRLHICRNGETEHQGDEVCQHLLRGFGKRAQHAALTDEVTKHEEADERDRARRKDARDDGDDDREEDLRRLRHAAAGVFHADQAFFFRGEQFDDRRLDNWYQRHIRVGRNDDRPQEIRMQIVGNEDRSRTVRRADDGDGRCVLEREAERRRTNEGSKNTKLRSSAKEHELRVVEQRLKVDHRANADKQQ